MTSPEDLTKLVDAVARSRVDHALALMHQLRKNDEGARDILAALQPISIFAFSHRWPSSHVPKENEYLTRLFHQVPERLHFDFLSRFVESVAWSPKYVGDCTATFVSGSERATDTRQRYLRAMEDHQEMPALFYAFDMAEGTGPETVLRLALQVGCNDIFKGLGHYFSCTDSLVRLAQRIGHPEAKIASVHSRCTSCSHRR